jgi:plasmid stabilization system protein ParE
MFRYSPLAEQQVKEYLRLIADDMVAIAAGTEIRRELLKLAADPKLGTAPTGPFESRPVYQFRLVAGDRPRLAQVSYRVGPDGLDILLFSAVPV